MTEDRDIKYSFITRLLKIGFWVFGVMLMILVSAILIIQIPSVQNAILQKLNQRLTHDTGYKSDIGYFNLKWFDAVVIKDLTVHDTRDSLMAHVDKLSADIDVLSLITGDEIHFNYVQGEGLLLNFIKHDDTSDFNLVEYINTFTPSRDTVPKDQPPVIFDEIRLDNSEYAFINEFDGNLEEGFNSDYFRVKNLNGIVRDFIIVGDSIQMQIEELSGVDEVSKLHIERMETLFRFSNTGMDFLGLSLKTAYSYLSDTITFRYAGQEELSDFINSVDIHANIGSRSFLGSKDLAVFASIFRQYNDTYSIQGQFDGTINNFDTRNLRLTVGDGSLIDGNISIDGLPDPDLMFIDASLREASILPNDAKIYLPDSAYAFINNLGRVRFSGSFLGFINDFVANGNFVSRAGRISSDINIKIPKDKPLEYKGRIAMDNLNVGLILDLKEIQRVTMNGSIDGKGVNIDEAQFKLEAYFDKFGLFDYNYTGINTNAELARSYFNGLLEINDPNLKINATAKVDLREGLNSIDLVGSLDTIRLKDLKLSKDELNLRTRVNVHMKGLQLDSLQGDGSFADLSLAYKEKDLSLDTMWLSVQRPDARRKSISFRSPLVNMDVKGDFVYQDAAKALKGVYQDFYQVFVKQDSTAKDPIQAFNTKLDIQDVSLDYNIDFKNIDPVLRLLNADVSLSDSARLFGFFETGKDYLVSATANFDTLRFGTNYFYDNQFDFNSSKAADSLDILAAVYFNSRKQQLGNLTSSENLTLDATWEDESLRFANRIRFDSANYFTINGNLKFFRDSLLIRFLPSNINLLDESWIINRKNSVAIRGRKIRIDSFGLRKENQEIKVNGEISPDPSSKLFTDISEFELDNLSPLIQIQLAGILNLNLELMDLYGSPTFNNLLDIQNLMVENLFVGHVNGKTDLDNENNRFEVDYKIEREELKIINLTGFYHLNRPEPLEMQASFDQADMVIFEPFIQDIFSDIRGGLSGKIDIGGEVDNPVINGNATIKNGQLRVNYLNSLYSLNGEIDFDDRRFIFRNVVLRDNNGDRADMSGNIRHEGLSNIFLDLRANMQNFEVLNTSIEDNDYFYGHAEVSGEANFTGPVDNMTIKVAATSEKGTRLYIPVSESTSVSQEDYIKFVDFTDTTFQRKTEEIIESKVNLEGLNLDFDLDLNTNAYVEIIFDIKAGDIIRGRGNGRINLQIDSNGEFYMIGNYTIEDGAYNFTLYNLINKEFQILPGSTISWSGDPYAAQMDIKAAYEQRTSLKMILADAQPQDQGSDETDPYDVPLLNRKYPAKVVLTLTGDLLSPQIEFSLDISEYPRGTIRLSNGETVQLEAQVQSFLTRIENDEQEMKRQVFSLLVLRRLSPINAFNVGVGGGLESSVSEMISNQLSYWINQVDQNLEVDIDLASLDEEALNTFQLRLSYTFLDGRLRVTRDGSIVNQNTNDLAAIAGDWTVEYLLTPDGKLRAKMYSRTNTANFTADEGVSATQGFSIEFTQSFDTIREIFQQARRRQKEKEKEEKTPADEARKEDEEIKPEK